MRTVAVVPAFNEAQRLSAVLDGVVGVVHRVLVIDDGSADGTAAVAQRCGALVLRHALTRGAGAATMTGILAARRLGAEVVVTIDADGQHDPRDLRAVLAPILAGQADLVIGSRFLLSQAVPWSRRLFNRIANVVTFLFTGVWCSDSQSGFKAFGPRALCEISLRLDGYGFCSEIIREAHIHAWRVVEVPVRICYSPETLRKGQHFGSGVVTFLKLLLRAFFH